MFKGEGTIMKHYFSFMTHVGLQYVFFKNNSLFQPFNSFKKHYVFGDKIQSFHLKISVIFILKGFLFKKNQRNKNISNIDIV